MSAVPWLKSTLDIAHAHYKESHHRKALTTQEMAQKEHVSGHQVAKTVAVKADERTIVLVLPASRKVSLGKVREVVGAEMVRLLSEGEIAFQFPDCEVGAIPPFRHWANVDLWMDDSLSSEQELLFHGGNHTDAICMPFSEWKEIANPKEGSFSIPTDWGGGKTGEDDEWRDTEDIIWEMEQGQGD